MDFVRRILGISLARGFSLHLIGFPANLFRLSVEALAQRFDRASAARNIWPVLKRGLLDLPMLEAETGIGGEEKDRALQAEDTQQHQTPLRGVPFPLHCGKRELLSNTPVTHT